MFHKLTNDPVVEEGKRAAAHKFDITELMVRCLRRQSEAWVWPKLYQVR